jgi:hypothetical protein
MTPARTLCLPRTPRSSDWSCSAHTWSPVTTATTMVWWESWRPEEHEWCPSLLVGAGCMSALGGCCEACWVQEELELAGCCEHSCACPTPQPLLCPLPAIKATAVNLPFLLVPALTFPSLPFPSVPFPSFHFLPTRRPRLLLPREEVLLRSHGLRQGIRQLCGVPHRLCAGGRARAPGCTQGCGGAEEGGRDEGFAWWAHGFRVLRAVLGGWSACHVPQQEAAACIC